MGTKEGAGNSGQNTSYTFKNYNAVVGANYYRLSQLDLDGKLNVLGVRFVTANFSDLVNISVYPNPFIQSIGISLPHYIQKTLTATLVSANGKTLTHQTLPKQENNEWQLKLDQNPIPGIYFLNIQVDNIDKTVSLLKQ